MNCKLKSVKVDFKKPIQAIDLASRILANNTPTNIDKITVINIDQGD